MVVAASMNKGTVAGLVTCIHVSFFLKQTLNLKIVAKLCGLYEKRNDTVTKARKCKVECTDNCSDKADTARKPTRKFKFTAPVLA